MNKPSPRTLVAISFLFFFLMRCWLISWPPVITDTTLYYQLAMNSTWNNLKVYLDFPFAYPWLSWLLVRWPAFIGPKLEFEGFRFFLQIFCFILEICTLGYLQYLTRRQKISQQLFYRSLFWYTIFSTLLGHLLYDRIDFFMTLCLFGVFAYWSKPNSKWLWHLSVFLGFSIKLLPLGFWIFKASDPKQRSQKGMLLSLGLPIFCILSLIALNYYPYPGMINSLSAHGSRGIQIESTWSTPFMLLKAFEPQSGIQIIDAYGAQEISPTNIPTLIMLLSKIVGFLTLGALWLHFFLKKKTLEGTLAKTTFFLCIIFCFLGLQRVLSTQFLIWATPFLAIYLALSKSIYIKVSTTIMLTLTFISFGFGYWQFVDAQPLFVSMVAIRNVLILFHFVYFLKQYLQEQKPRHFIETD